MKQPLILAAHRYIGLATAVFFLVTSVTGGLLLYKHAILYAWYPALEDAKVAATQAPPGQDQVLLADLWRQHAQRPIRSVVYPSDGWPFYNVYYTDGGSAYLTPAGDVLVESRGLENPVALLFEIHHDWLLGHAGELASGYLHLLVLLLIATGIYAWWPRHWRKSLHVVWRGSLVKMSYSWHRVLGIASALVLLLAVGTGVMMVFYGQAQWVLTGLFGGKSELISREVSAGESYQPWEVLHPRIEQTFAEGDLRLVIFPQAEDQALVVRKRMPGEWHQNGRSFIYINPYSGEVYAARNAMEEELGIRLTYKIYPLHSAGVGGDPYVTLLAVAGFVPLVLIPTGIYVWWWRRQRRRRGAH